MSLAVLSFPYYTSRASLELFTLLVVSTLNIMFFTQPRHQQDPLLEAKNSGHGKINTSSLLLFLTFSLFHLQQLHPVLPTVRHIQKHKHHPVSSSNNSSSQPHTQTHHEQHSKVRLSFVYVCLKLRGNLPPARHPATCTLSFTGAMKYKQPIYCSLWCSSKLVGPDLTLLTFSLTSHTANTDNYLPKPNSTLSWVGLFFPRKHKTNTVLHLF